MNKVVKSLSIILFLFCFYSSNSQEFKCGTVVTQAQVNYERQHPSTGSREGSPAPLLCLNKVLSVYIHIITDSLNQTNITQAKIDSGLIALNLDFAPVCLQFKVCQQDTIYNYKYDKFDKVTELPEITTLYVKPKVINVFIMTSINPGNDGGLASFTADWILLTKGSFVYPWKTWSHEMGHFLSLYHTWETTIGTGAEFANGSNCATGGDLVCDTEADVDPAQFAPNSCKYIGTSTDPAGNLLTPIIGNIMSYHPGICKSPFTVGQLNRMANYYLSFRNYLY